MFERYKHLTWQTNAVVWFVSVSLHLHKTHRPCCWYQFCVMTAVDNKKAARPPALKKHVQHFSDYELHKSIMHFVY